MVLVPADLMASVALSLAVVLVVAIARSVLYSSSSKQLPAGTHALPRAPSSHWLLGDLPALLSNMTRFNDWIYETTLACGERPWLRSAPVIPDMVIVTTPAIIEDVTRTQSDVFGKGDFTHDLLQELVGGSFFSRDGDAWFHQRKTATKFFTARMYREVAMPVMHTHVARALAKLENAQHDTTLINLTELINAFALQNFAELAFGLNIDQVDPTPLDHALDEAFEHLFGRVQKPMWLWKLQRWLNVGDERKFRRTATFIRDFVSTLVSQSLAKSAIPEDDEKPARTIVELFIAAMQKSDDHAFSPELLCDLALMFVLASRDTTADTFNWFFYSLSRHPHVEQRIRDELRANVPELMDGSISMLSVDQTHSLVYLEAVIKETLRLFPPVTLNPRQALCDAVLVDGTFVPKGTSMGISAYTLGRLTNVWGDDAAQFNPDRFLDPATGRLVPVSPFKFFGFGAGARNCIGMNLALLEMKMLIASVLGRFQLEMAPNDGKYKFSATLTIQQPLLARVTAVAKH